MTLVYGFLFCWFGALVTASSLAEMASMYETAQIIQDSRLNRQQGPYLLRTVPLGGNVSSEGSGKIFELGDGMDGHDWMVGQHCSWCLFCGDSHPGPCSLELPELCCRRLARNLDDVRCIDYLRDCQLHRGKATSSGRGSDSDLSYCGIFRRPHSSRLSCTSQRCLIRFWDFPKQFGMEQRRSDLVDWPGGHEPPIHWYDTHASFGCDFF